MRRSFASALAEIAATDDRIVLLTGDLGYMALEAFADPFPDRFVNVGVAEQNMIGMATGLAESGFIPYCYSIGTFATLRAYEMIRNGPIAHGLPVRIVGVGGGFEYGHNGVSHYPIEDVALMRTQPGMAVITPADHRQARAAVLSTWDHPGPVYYRLGKDDHTVVEGLDGRFELGSVDIVRKGSDVVLLAMGAAALDAVDAATRLEADGIMASVAVVSALNPAPVDDLREILAQHSLVVSVEAHYVNGALGSLAAEVIAETGLNCRLLRCGVEATPDGRSGSQTYLNALHGIGPEQVGDRVIAALA
jgi:transketolase